MRSGQIGHWRDSARSVRFFFIDGQAAFPVLLAVLWPRLWTFALAFAATCFFTLLKRFHFTPMVFFRYLRTLVAGPRVYSRPWWME